MQNNNYKLTGLVVGGIFILIAVGMFFLASGVKKKEQAIVSESIDKTVDEKKVSEVVTDTAYTAKGIKGELDNSVDVFLSEKEEDFTTVSLTETIGELVDKGIRVRGNCIYYVYSINVAELDNVLEYFVSADSYNTYKVGQEFKITMYKSRGKDGYVYHSVKSLRV